jgi:hypothetical protein
VEQISARHLEHARSMVTALAGRLAA